MFRIDVYRPAKKGNKKCASHWYPTLEEAENARLAVIQLPVGYHNYFNKQTRFLNGIKVTKPVEDSKY